MAGKRKFWEFKAAANQTEGELYLYGDISTYSWWGDEITPNQFKEDLDTLGDIATLHVYINSNGGDVFAGQAIHSMLKRHKAQVVVHIDGLAASIASVIAMAGDRVVMPRNAMMMVHNPWIRAGGNAEELRKIADDLDKICESLVAAYQDKTGLTIEEIQTLLDAETWMTADECVEKGFADEIEQSKAVAASLCGDFLNVNGREFDLSRFHKRPAVAKVEDLLDTLRDEDGKPVALPQVTIRVEGDQFIAVVGGVDVGVYGETQLLVEASGRVLSKENEDHIRNAHEALGNVLAKLDKSEDEDPENHEPMHDPDEEMDNKEKAAARPPWLDELNGLVEKAEAAVKSMAAISMPANPSEPVTPPNPDGVIDILPDTVSGKVRVPVPAQEESVIEIVDSPAKEVEIEPAMLQQTVKAAVDEAMRERLMKLTGRVD